MVAFLFPTNSFQQQLCSSTEIFYWIINQSCQNTLVKLLAVQNLAWTKKSCEKLGSREKCSVFSDSLPELLYFILCCFWYLCNMYLAETLYHLVRWYQNSVWKKIILALQPDPYYLLTYLLREKKHFLFTYIFRSALGIRLCRPLDSWKTRGTNFPFSS